MEEEIKLIIDYNKTIEQVIVEGKYIQIDDNIFSKDFPVSAEKIGKKIEVSAKLFWFNSIISSNDAISEMDKAGYRPATIMELLFFGILFPEPQRQFTIVALGSTGIFGVGHPYSPYLKDNRFERQLCLGFFAGSWVYNCRFLAIRKEIL